MKRVADNIPAYTYGTAAVPRSPVSLDELEELKISAGFTAEDERLLRLAGEVLRARLSRLSITGGAVSSPASPISRGTRALPRAMLFLSI